MSEKSTFFNSVSGDRKYKAEDMALHFSKVLTNGVMPSGTQLQATADSGMNIVVSAGSAWINGYAYHNDSDFTLEVDPADGVLNRIDRIVVRWSRLNRAINLVVIKGVAASSPAAPALVRNVDSYDLGIATISVGNGITAITQAMIADTRMDGTVCGFVGSLIQPDTAGWFTQFETAFNDAISENQSNWAAWFATVQDILDENTAGNLLNLINDIDAAKTDKVTSAVAGNFAGLDATGNLVDSGFSAGNFSQSNRNLLDNWYFPNPINQRKKTSYTTDGYTIDRWKSYLINMTLSSSGLALGTRSGTDAQIYQIIEGLDTSQTYTFSWIGNGELYSITAIPGSGAWTNIIPNTAYYSLANWNGQVAVVISLSQGKTMMVKAAKLELGTTQTLARKVGDNWVLNDPAPNYQQELAKCQRYQIAFRYGTRAITPLGIAHCNPSSSGKALISVALPVPLRAAPTIVTDITKLCVRGPGVFYNSFNSIAIDSFGVGSIALLATNATALTSGFGDCYIDNGDLLLDANL